MAAHRSRARRSTSLVVVAGACALLLAACSDAPGVARSSAPDLPLTGVSAAPAVPARSGPATVISYVSAAVDPGRNARVEVTTAPAAACRVSMLVQGRPVRASGLVPRTASARGAVAWTWTVPSRTPRGEWEVVVACTPGGEAATLLLVR
jgi:hypothetical protein